MKKQLQEMLNGYMKSEGVDVSSSIRDCLTDLIHIADENKISINPLINGAKEVFNIEKDAEN